jgi:serine protease
VGSPSVTIGIIDTGKTDHPDLIDKWHPFLKYNAVTQSYDAYDNGDWAHGTAVASVAAAETYNGGGIVGACPLCSLVPIKVSNDANDGQILLSSVIDAVNWSTLNELDIVNLSFEGFKPCSHPDVSALKEVLTDAISEGVIVVAAAGNFSTDASSTYPASCPGVVTVAALDQTASLSLYSNYGSVVDIAAPAGGGTITVPPFSGLGEGIVCPPDPDSFFSPYQLGAISAWRTSPATGGAYCYRYLSGTSMAAPYVSGIIGLMRSVSPQINPSVVLEIVQDSAYDVIEVNCPQDCGAGLISVEHAVYLAELHEYGLY